MDKVNVFSPRVLTYLEFIAVAALIFSSFGAFDFSEMPMHPGEPIVTTNESLLDLIRLELFALLILLLVFLARGRSLRTIQWQVRPDLPLVVFLLFATDYLLADVAASIARLWFPAWDTSLPFFKNARDLSLPLVFAFSCVNGFFEELVVVGYVTACLGRFHGPVFCGAVSVVLRLSYHLYQGPVNVLAMVPMAVVFYFTYWKWKSIWPLIITHAVMNYVYIAVS